MFIDYMEVEDAWGTVGISRDRFAPVNLWNFMKSSRNISRFKNAHLWRKAKRNHFDLNPFFTVVTKSKYLEFLCLPKSDWSYLNCYK